MLSAEYLSHIAEGAEAVAEELHVEIINRIVERILIRMKRGEAYMLTSQDKWQLETLEEAGFLLEDIQKELAGRVGKMQREVAEAMEEAGVKALAYDDNIYKAAGLSPVPLEQSPHLIRLMQRNYEATMGTWNNFTRTTANEAQKLFINECSKAYSLVASGTTSYTEAFLDALNKIASDGLVVEYPSGHKDTIETATLRAVRTGVAQATAQITDARMAEMNWDIILVSSHFGARTTGKGDFTDHAAWQGKFYSRSGADKRFPLFQTACNPGHVQGICGANCGHSYGPGDGEFNPFNEYDTEENRKQYELTQRQRTIERRIRKTKLEVMARKTAKEKNADPAMQAQLDVAYEKKAALLQRQNKAYREFCDENNLRPLQERLAVAKWDRKQAAKARAAAKHRERSLQLINNDAIIKKTSGLPIKLKDLPNEKLAHTVNANVDKSDKLPNGFHAVTPQNAILKKVEVMAGAGTSSPIRDLRRLYDTYGLSPEKWEKKSGTVYGKNYHYVIHWYEHDGFVPTDEIKLKGMKANK